MKLKKGIRFTPFYAQLLAFLVQKKASLKHQVKIREKNIFPRQSLKRFTFRVKLSGSIFFLLGLSPIVKLI